MLKNYTNMGMQDRIARTILGSALVYLGFFKPDVIDDNVLNVLVAAFGVLNIISSLVKICPAYLLANISTARSIKTSSGYSDSAELLNEQGNLVEASSLRKKLLLSVFLPMFVLLCIFSALVFNLGHQHELTNITKKADVAAEFVADSIRLRSEVEYNADDPVFSEPTLSILESGLESVDVFFLHDSNANPVESVIAKGMDNVSVLNAMSEHHRSRGDEINKGSRGMLVVGDKRYIWSTNYAGAEGRWFTSVMLAPDTHTITRQLFSPRFAVIILSVIILAVWSSAYIIKKFLDNMERSARQLQYRTYHDTLTGLPNRLSIESIIHRKTQSVDAQGGCVALLMMDVIGFREINDTLGYALGDKLLVAIGNHLNEIDANDGNVVMMGGDVFSVVCQTSHDRLTLSRLSNKIQDKLENSQYLENYPVTIQVRIGMACYPGDASSPEELIRCSDIALAQAKSQRLKSYYYNTDLDTHSIRKLTLLSRLRTAIEQDELTLVYQPKVDIQKNTLEGVEVLVRWIDAEYGSVSPVEFVTWAEKSGLIDKLTHWVLKTAEKQSAQWQRQGICIPFAVNLSPTNLFDKELVPLVERLVGENGSFANGLLELEITENAVMEDPERALDTMHQLGRLGVEFAIDDFGTGLSSFAYLRKFPVHNLKIDRAFILETDDSDKEAILLQSMITLGHQLGCVVTAEGVEDQPTLERLRDMKCNLVQGYHICRPLSGENLLEWIDQGNWTALPRAA